MTVPLLQSRSQFSQGNKENGQEAQQMKEGVLIAMTIWHAAAFPLAAMEGHLYRGLITNVFACDCMQDGHSPKWDKSTWGLRGLVCSWYKSMLLSKVNRAMPVYSSCKFSPRKQKSTLFLIHHCIIPVFVLIEIHWDQESYTHMQLVLQGGDSGP